MSDDRMDYATLRDHVCLTCESHHWLAALPAQNGWDAAVRCRCSRNGHVIRYSTEATGFATFDAAELAVADLLLVPTEAVKPPDNIHYRPDSDRWVVQILRKPHRFYRSFRTEEEAIQARDDFLEAA